MEVVKINMTAKAAYGLFKRTHPDKEASLCKEYRTLFVFMLEGSTTKTIDCLISVSKINGLVRDFKPFHISPDEYKKGEVVEDFK